MPPAPFELIEQDDDGPIPERPIRKTNSRPISLSVARNASDTIEATDR